MVEFLVFNSIHFKKVTSLSGENVFERNTSTHYGYDIPQFRTINRSVPYGNLTDSNTKVLKLLDKVIRKSAGRYFLAGTHLDLTERIFKVSLRIKY